MNATNFRSAVSETAAADSVLRAQWHVCVLEAARNMTEICRAVSNMLELITIII